MRRIVRFTYDCYHAPLIFLSKAAAQVKWYCVSRTFCQYLRLYHVQQHYSRATERCTIEKKKALSYLVGHEGRKVGLLRRVILGERPDVSAVLLRALLGEEPKGSVAGSLELTVGHGASGVCWEMGGGGSEHESGGKLKIDTADTTASEIGVCWA